jgi:hypothetical protein
MHLSIVLVTIFIPLYTFWAIYDRFNKRSELLNYIKRTLGNEEFRIIKSKKHYVGMPAPILTYLMGRPDKINENVDAENVYHHYLYGEFKNRLGNIKYKYRVTCINGYVESFGDL